MFRGVPGRVIAPALASLVVATIPTTSSASTGTWTIINSSNQDNYALAGISCPSVSDCWAVGERPGNSKQQTLIEHYSGSAWAVASSPNTTADENNVLSGVSCASSMDCWAVGSHGDTVESALIEHYNGSGWSISASPSSSAGYRLNGVTCSTSTNCWAVGTMGGTAAQTLVEHYGGSGWTVVSSPNTSPNQLNVLSGIACDSQGGCWAVGYYDNASGNEQTLVERFSGGVWSLVSSPPSSGSNDVLQSVACANATNCWAVGNQRPVGSAALQTLMLQYNGTDWAVGSSPIPGPAPNVLSSVACTSSTECWAVGSHATGYSIEQTLIEHNTGSGWAIVSSPDTYSSDRDDLVAVACADAADCSAVGSYYNGVTWRTLIEARWSTTTYQDNSRRVAYNSWRGVTDAAASGGTYRTSGTKGATVTYAFSGTSITLFTRKGPDQGIASVTIDGVSQGQLDLYDPSPQSFSQYYSFLASTTHTFVLTVTGTRNPASSGNSVALDALSFAHTWTEDSSIKVTYNSFVGKAATAASGGTYRTSAAQGANARLTFTGTGVDWITASGPDGGMASVSVDGSIKLIVDLYSPSIQWQKVVSYTGLALGSHSVVITILGSNNSSSSGMNVIFDAFVVHS